MSDTMSSPNEWVQFHHQQQQYNPYGQVVASSTNSTTPTTAMFGGIASVATVTTTTTTVTSPSNTTNSSSSSFSLNPEGRVSKPIRRRSRASKRTPTTLLNTDTTNFRAMVQQFTGGTLTAPPFASGMSHHYGSGATNMSFDSHRPIRTAAAMVPSAYNPMQFQHHHHHSSTTGDDGFFQRLSNNGNTGFSMEVADHIGGGGGGFDKLEGVSSQVMLSRPSSSSNNNENHHSRSNIHYMF